MWAAYRRFLFVNMSVFKGGRVINAIHYKLTVKSICVNEVQCLHGDFRFLTEDFASQSLLRYISKISQEKCKYLSKSEHLICACL